MGSDLDLRCHEHVNQPYARVSELLRADAVGLFARATRGAASQAERLRPQLAVRLGAVELSAPVEVTIVSVDDAVSPLHSPATRFGIEWRACTRTGLFPEMQAVLWVYALSARETQVVFTGRYAPPLGLLGAVLDALVGRRVAEACARRFVEDVAAELRHELAGARCA